GPGRAHRPGHAEREEREQHTDAVLPRETGARDALRQAPDAAADQDEQRIERREHRERRVDPCSEQDERSEREQGLEEPAAQARHPFPGHLHPVPGPAGALRRRRLAHLFVAPSLWTLRGLEGAWRTRCDRRRWSTLLSTPM